MEGHIYQWLVAQSHSQCCGCALFFTVAYMLFLKPNSCFWDIHKRQTPNNAQTDRVVPANLLLGTHLSSQTALINPAFLLSI